MRPSVKNSSAIALRRSGDCVHVLREQPAAFGLVTCDVTWVIRSMWQLLWSLVFAMQRLLPGLFRPTSGIAQLVRTCAEQSVRAIRVLPSVGLLAAGWCPRRLMAEFSDPYSTTSGSDCPTALQCASRRELDLRRGSLLAMSPGRLLPARVA